MEETMTLTLSLLFPKDPNLKAYAVNYPSVQGVPIPAMGDLVSAPGCAASYPVKYRTWGYNSPTHLTITLACFDGN
jgi:hypothetical protein